MYVNVTGKKKPGRMKASNSRMKFGDTTDDVHICIMCLRAIMNHQVTMRSFRRVLFRYE